MQTLNFTFQRSQYELSLKVLGITTIIVLILGTHIFSYHFNNLSFFTYALFVIIVVLSLYCSSLLHELPKILFVHYKKEKAIFRINPFWCYKSIRHAISMKMDLFLGSTGFLLNVLLFMLCNQTTLYIKHFPIPKIAACCIDFVRISNAGLIILNLLPASNFDCGKLLHWLISFFFKKNVINKATMITDTVIYTGLILFGMWSLLSGWFTSGVIICSIGVALREVSITKNYPYTAYRDWESLKITDFICKNYTTIPISLSKHECIQKFAYTYSHLTFPVIGKDNFFHGIVSLNTIIAALPSEMTLDSFVKKADICDITSSTDSIKSAKTKFITGTDTLYVIDTEGVVMGVFTLKKMMDVLVRFFEHRDLIPTM